MGVERPDRDVERFGRDRFRVRPESLDQDFHLPGGQRGACRFRRRSGVRVSGVIRCVPLGFRCRTAAPFGSPASILSPSGVFSITAATIRGEATHRHIGRFEPSETLLGRVEGGPVTGRPGTAPGGSLGQGRATRP